MEFTDVRGERVPKVGLGTWRLEGEECFRTVRTALELGYRHVDTAQAYDNERQVGRALAASSVDRDDAFLTTKVWPGYTDREEVVRSAAASCSRLGVESVDLLLIHWPNPLASTAEVMAGLNDCRDRGLTRHVGVSNFSTSQLRTARAASDAPVFTDQVQFHPFRPQRDLRAYCRAHDVLLTAYSPLAHGGVLRDDVLREVGVRYDKSPAQVALRWAVQQEGVVAVPKASSETHLRENLDVFDFELSEAEMVRIERPSRLRTGASMLRGRFGV
ncbi:aldo/keto reductase (plasmid) [Halorussus salilacus]|uniref:aldo/keto reductase n=1 Tax=Halorussus salilacus TaxID=2953750 RepID=UPI0020A090C5|nr:aldo/keto reductase [Halorussus salilacus]USZ69775.1 aldo/keto reductase [Halorussus salilacus]